MKTRLSIFSAVAMTLTLLGPALMGVSCGDKVGASTDASKETDPGAVTQNWAIPRGGSSLQGRVPDAVLRKPRVKWDAVLDGPIIGDAAIAGGSVYVEIGRAHV